MKKEMETKRKIMIIVVAILVILALFFIIKGFDLTGNAVKTRNAPCNVTYEDISVVASHNKRAFVITIFYNLTLTDNNITFNQSDSNLTNQTTLVIAKKEHKLICLNSQLYFCGSGSNPYTFATTARNRQVKGNWICIKKENKWLKNIVNTTNATNGTVVVNESGDSGGSSGSSSGSSNTSTTSTSDDDDGDGYVHRAVDSTGDRVDGVVRYAERGTDSVGHYISEGAESVGDYVEDTGKSIHRHC